MTTPKRSSNWYIALVHFLIAGLAIPFFVGFIGSLIIAPLFITTSIFGSLSAVLVIVFSTIILGPLGTWYGTKYSASYLKRVYIIEDKDRIINLSIIYLVALPTLYKIYQVASGDLKGLSIVLNFLGLIINAIIFYVFSKKYISKSEIK